MAGHPPTQAQHPFGGREALGGDDPPAWSLLGAPLCQRTEVGASVVLLVIPQIAKHLCPGTHAYVTRGHKPPYTTAAPHKHPATGSQTSCYSSIHRNQRLRGWVLGAPSHGPLRGPMEGSFLQCLVVESSSNLRKLTGRGRAFSPMNEIQALAQILHPMTANCAALAPASSQRNIVVVLNDTRATCFMLYFW